MFTGIIYKSTCIINGKSYIGSTKRTLNKRKSEHYTLAKYDKTRSFYSDINKYGKENFKWEIIYECDSEEEMISKETYFIKFYNTCGENGYNMTKGGRGRKGQLFKIRTIIFLKNGNRIIFNNYDIESQLNINPEWEITWMKVYRFYRKKSKNVSK